MKVTAKDVATMARVSIPAVTLAFRGYGRQKLETRKKILGIAKELGYRPNLLVDSLRTGRTRTIGVMVSLKDTPALEMFNGIAEILSKYDHVPIVVTPDKNNNEEQQLHRLLERRVDGIILLPRHDAMYEEHLAELIQKATPLVIMDNVIAGDKLAPYFVGTDDLGGGVLAARHLLEQGHRKLAIFTTDSYPKPMHFRKEGFESEVNRCSDAMVFTVATHLNAKNHLQLAKEILKLKPTAIFATNDSLLPCLYEAAAEFSMKIPDDISLVGFAGLPLTRYLIPPATTLLQPFYEIGKTAAEMLLKQINGEKIIERKVLYPAELLIRKSTAKPKS